MTTNLTPYFGENMKSGSGILAEADFSGTTSVAANHGPLGVGGFASAQFQFVTIGAFTGAGSSSASLAGAVLVSVAGTGGVKVLGNKPQLGDPCQLFDIGEVKVVAGAALTVGALVMTDSVGRAVPWVDESGNVPVGECRLPANGANDICTIFIFPNFAGETSFSAQNLVAATTPGVQATAELTVIGTTVSSGIVVMPPAIAGQIFAISDIAGGGSNHTAITPNGSDTIRAGSPGTITTAANHESYIFWCAVAGNWEYVKSA
ncbi:MAG: hypothetical protein ACHRHE_15650 [Tepidisphaerales bacterium]